MSSIAERRLQEGVARVLRWGVLLAAWVVLAGGIAYLARHGGEPAHYSVFRGEPSELRSVSGIVLGVAALDGRGIIQFGLLILIATPIARVAYALAAFARAGDRVYAGIAAAALTVLAWSLAWRH